MSKLSFWHNNLEYMCSSIQFDRTCRCTIIELDCFVFNSI